MNLPIKRLVCTSAMVAVLSATMVVGRTLLSGGIQEPWQHQTLAAFSLDRTFPVVSNGYLVSHLRTVTSATHQNAVFVLALKTGEQRVIPFWLSEASEIHLESAAVRPDGSVLLGGSYTRSPQDTDAAARFVAELGPTGAVVRQFDLGEYLPERLCGTSDGGFWTFGQVFKQEYSGGDYAFLRRYSPRGELVRQYFPRSLLPAGLTLDYRAHGRNVAFLSCGDTSVAAYVGRGTPPQTNRSPRFVWFEVNASTGVARSLAVRNPGGASSITALVLLSEGRAFASYSRGGLYQLTAGSGASGTWVLIPSANSVSKTASATGNTLRRSQSGLLLGRDGESLVHLVGPLTINVRQTVYWSRVSR